MKTRLTAVLIRTMLLLLVLPLLLSCQSSSLSQEENEIRNIIYDISHDFSWNDIQCIVDHLHPDYRHNGMQSLQFRELWLNRRASFDLLDCDISGVEIQGDYATVHLRLDFQSATDDLSYDDPQTSGDISFFFYDRGAWQLYGNQELVAVE